MSQPLTPKDSVQFMRSLWERNHMRGMLLHSISENPLRVLDIIDDMLWIPEAYEIAKDQLLLGHPSRRDKENNDSRCWRREKTEKGIDTTSLPALKDDLPFISERPFADLETRELEEAKKLGYQEGREKGRLEGREEGRRLGEKSGIDRGLYQGFERGRRVGEETGYAKGYAEGCKSNRIAEVREQAIQTGFQTGKLTGEESGYARGYAKGLAEGMGRIEGLVLKKGVREREKGEGQTTRRTRRGARKRATRQEAVVLQQD